MDNRFDDEHYSSKLVSMMRSLTLSYLCKLPVSTNVPSVSNAMPTCSRNSIAFVQSIQVSNLVATFLFYFLLIQRCLLDPPPLICHLWAGKNGGISQIRRNTGTIRDFTTLPSVKPAVCIAWN